MNGKTHRGDRRSYFRYCGGCGWGFTRAQWHRAAYCTQCGAELDRGTSTDTKRFSCFDCGRRFSSREWRSVLQCPGCGKRFHHKRRTSRKDRPGSPSVATPEVLPPSRSSSGIASRLPHHARDAIRIADRHPFMSAAGTGLAGAGMIVGGQAISALGAGAATVGGVIAGINMLGMFVAAGTGARGLAELQFKGVGVGLGLMLAGTGVSLAGQAISLGGYVATGGAGLVAGYGVLKATREHRHRLAQADTTCTLPGHTRNQGSVTIQRRESRCSEQS
jgi:DNA-directed RNA polymerase subunit RPC12/RpoP